MCICIQISARLCIVQLISMAARHIAQSWCDSLYWHSAGKSAATADSGKGEAASGTKDAEVAQTEEKATAVSAQGAAAVKGKSKNAKGKGKGKKAKGDGQHEGDTGCSISLVVFFSVCKLIWTQGSWAIHCDASVRSG